MIRNNILLDNYNNGLDCGGGVIAVQACGRNVQILNNFLWNQGVFTAPSFCGPTAFGNPNDPYAFASGLELWGYGLTVSGNRIEYFPTEGVGLLSVWDATVQNNVIQNTSRGIQERHVDNNSATNADPEEHDRPAIMLTSCQYDPKASRPFGKVTISGNLLSNRSTVYQSYGVRVMRDICDGPPNAPEPNPARMEDLFFSLNQDNPNSPNPANRQGIGCTQASPLVTVPIVYRPGSQVLPACASVIGIGVTSGCGPGGCQ